MRFSEVSGLRTPKASQRRMPSTMKIFGVLLPLLLVVVTPTTAFVSPVFVQTKTHNVALKETAAEAYLDQCLNEWDVLDRELVNLKARAKVSNDENVSVVVFCRQGVVCTRRLLLQSTVLLAHSCITHSLNLTLDTCAHIIIMLGQSNCCS